MCVKAYAQITSTNYIDYLGFEKRFNDSDYNFDGSPYVTDYPCQGYVLFEGYRLDNTRIRYNAYKNNLELDISGMNYIVKMEKIIEFSWEIPETKRIVLYKKIKIEEDKNLILEILHNGKVMLGVNNKVIKKRGSGSGAGDALNPSKDILTMIQTYYLVIEGNVIKVQRNMKSFLNALGEYGGLVKAYIDKNKLNIKNDLDMLKALSYYESVIN